MATIAISDLNTPGLDLFQDSESFLNELKEDELNMTRGGGTPAVIILTILLLTPQKAY